MNINDKIVFVKIINHINTLDNSAKDKVYLLNQVMDMSKGGIHDWDADYLNLAYRFGIDKYYKNRILNEIKRRNRAKQKLIFL